MTDLNRRHFGRVAAAATAGASALQAAAARTMRIDSALRGGVGPGKIPAAVGMIAKGRSTLYEGAFGTRDQTGVAVRMDSIFNIASMTKAITTVAALQLVEQGKLGLDEPASKHLPQLARLQVLEGFEPRAEVPRLRPAKIPVTLRHLVTHTSGFCYDMWDAGMYRYAQWPGKPPGAMQPLLFEPGSRWQYGEGLDWAGRLVEAVSGMSLEDYFQANIFKPLAMPDTSYIVSAAKFDRVVSGYARNATGALEQRERVLPTPPKTYGGGGGLYSTCADYVRFMQMILGKGTGANKAKILKPETVAAMGRNQIGVLGAGKMRSFRHEVSADVDIQPGFDEKWGLGFLINTTAYEGGRSAGSLAWAGLFNTFYWIDPKRAMCGVLMMQFLPFVDATAVKLLDEFERAAYGD